MLAGEPGKQRRNTGPVRRHPLFPAVVALWFGALFGLGSLAVRPELLDSAVLSVNADLGIPAAAAPLGMTSRSLFALAMALCGGLLGATLALLLARPRTAVRARDAHPDAPPRRPISAHEELGGDRADASRNASPTGPDRQRPPAGKREDEQERRDAGTLLTHSAPPPGEAARRILAADLEGLSHLELIERLAISLQRRQENRAAPATDPGPAEPFVTFPDRAARYDAQPPGYAGAARTTLQGLPAQATGPRNPEETERALRDALATLQRMSGAA